MIVFICQLSRAENIEYIELAIRKSKLETVKSLLQESQLSPLSKKYLAKKAHVQAIKRKVSLYSNSSSKGFRRIICGYALATAGLICAIKGDGKKAVTSLAAGISLSQWGNHAHKKELTKKTLSKAKKYEASLSIEELLKKESSSDSAKKDQQ